MGYYTRYKIELLEPVSGEEYPYKPYPSPVFAAEICEKLHNIAEYTFYFDKDEGHIFAADTIK